MSLCPALPWLSRRVVAELALGHGTSGTSLAFLRDALKGRAIFFPVHKLPVRAALGPGFSLGIIDLGAIAYRAIAVTVAFRRVCSQNISPPFLFCVPDSWAH